MLRNLLRVLLTLPGLYPLAAFLFGRRVVIRGWSMYPTLAPGEYVLFDRFAYRRSAPRRGDIVLASHPSKAGMRIVKRLAAVPGDRVAIDGERCWVNEVPFGERRPAGPSEPSPSARTWTLGDDEFLRQWPFSVTLQGDVQSLRPVLDWLTDVKRPIPLTHLLLKQPPRSSPLEGQALLQVRAASILVRPDAALTLEME